ncbi:hypothetical protein [Bacillus sp. ISL-7]|uniref:hypothetical protein n=1 Tax=Bacillus sp. ISL-7 TaxID=2819136 RepID=UPI001BECA80C|nr:hypothetical protein [Bacillus sp. ISL-7]MBT2736604.1 hypothetical protein [Bacillus sp. ISL-7]
MNTTKKLFTIFAIISIVVLMLNSAGPFEGQFRVIGFILFTLLCLGIGIESRKSTWKVITITVFWIVFGLVQMV